MTHLNHNVLALFYFCFVLFGDALLFLPNSSIDFQHQPDKEQRKVKHHGLVFEKSTSCVFVCLSSIV